ncbi:MAG TPA: lytic transglycosylase domain-containing protein [Aurantimonas coralicida]|uniref:Lytic transglycosylase domain-containing protein n=2 Tax=root TaxID=1 RepID=A0A9C9NKI1_9HYPH|nr:lytic transglycosylase domain-containing protein [Aurantimonas coralicida]HEU02980.1 lytic transglycosylase domain-containing protein [Aurantimonas coralicida]
MSLFDRRSRRRAAARLALAARPVVLLLLSGFLSAATPPIAALAQSAPVERSNLADPFAAYVAEASHRFGIPDAWIRAVMRFESAGRVRAISSTCAIGLMQVMPGTWAELQERYGLGSDPYDPRDNILAGAAYLREMYDRYGSPGFLAAYNAGPRRYEQHLAGRPLPAETRAYLATLAPVVGGGDMPVPAIVAAADPDAWRRAPLFVGRAAGAATADSVQVDGQSKAASAATPVADSAAAAPQAERLFVARSDRGRPR